VSVLEDTDVSSDSTEILNLEKRMCTNVERGLQTIAVHPDFEKNRYIYLYYTKHKDDCLADDSENGPWNVVSRFVMNPETLMLDYDEREEIWRLVIISSVDREHMDQSITCLFFHPVASLNFISFSVIYVMEIYIEVLHFMIAFIMEGQWHLAGMLKYISLLEMVVHQNIRKIVKRLMAV